MLELSNSASPKRQRTEYRSAPLLYGTYSLPDSSETRYDRRLFDTSVKEGTRLLFENSLATLLADTQWHSAVSEITRHPHFEAIVGMGTSAAQIILERMEKGEIRVHWFPMLKRITKDDPVPVQARGDLTKMARAWLRWGKKRRFLAS